MATPRTEKERLFNAAAELTDPARQAAFLDAACGEDAALRAELEDLLRHDEAAGSFLGRPALAPRESQPPGPGSSDTSTDAAGPGGAPAGAEPPATIDSPGTGGEARGPSPTAEGPGTRIGPYKLLQPIGEGGMGVVYLAEQEHPVRRKVALKIIKPGMDTAQVVARFEAERQALALMDHPNIAKVHDAGATDTGRPYFVMELVNGIPITDYCDQARLTPRERLELFVPVCRALQHAHQKGIIHRDVKPSNVLITLIDGRPVPKVIDFGIAKATDQRLTERTLFTQHGAVVGTFEYMSPEQAALSGVDIDTRSDVYSLGVLLYELLTGTTPLGRARLREAGYAEILRLIREEEPVKPSTRLSDSGQALPSIAATRATEPTRLARLVRGELDWIVMKALEKDRARRYDSAGGFARDVEKYLADEPVEACPPSRRYRLGKFARRHRAALAVAASFAAMLLIAASVSTWLAIRARRERDRAVEAETMARAERDRAAAAERATRSEADKVKAVNEFLTEDLLTQAEPGKNAAESKVTLREVLDRAAAKVGERFREKPEAEIVIRRAISNTYHGLGAWAQAEQQAVAMLEIERRLNGDDGVNTLLALGELAHMRDHLGRTAEALEALRRADEGLRRRLGADDPRTMTVRQRMAMACQSAGRTAEAIPIVEDMLERFAAKLGPDHPDILKLRMDLGNLYRTAGRTAEAIPMLEDALRRSTAGVGPDHPSTLRLRHTLGLAYTEAGRAADEIPFLEETLKRIKAQIGPDHVDTFASLTNLARAYVAAGRAAEALPLQEDVLRHFEAKLGPDHPWTLGARNNLGATYFAAGRAAEALPQFEAIVRRSQSVP
jgi:serine/threonine protein kinase/tetratricopeptide (TPR) repeat protein